MAVVQSHGPDASPLGPLGTNNDVKLTEGGEVPNPDKILSQRQYVLNTYTNENAINTGRFTDVAELLRAFGEGSPVTVTYYHRMDQDGNVKGIHKSVDETLDRVHAAYLKIHGFELKITSSVNYEHLTDDAVVQVTGEAITYPGFEPKIGDRFIMEMDTGKFAMMEINELPVRLSLRSQSYWRIRFIMTDWVSDEFLDIIEKGVRKEAWFDKQRFLTEPGALLVHDEVVLMQRAKEAISQMLTFYVDKFFERLNYSSLIRPDQVFDPYVVDFMRQVCDYRELRGLPEQFVPDATAMKISWWAWLLNPKQVPKVAVPKGWFIKYNRIGSRSVRVNALVNRPYISLIGHGDDMAWGSVVDSNTNYGQGSSLGCNHKCQYPDRWPPNPYYPEECENNGGGDPEPTEPNGYLEDFILVGTDEDSAFRAVISRYEEDQVIEPTSLLNAFDEVYMLPDEAQFYQFPVLIFLAKLCIKRIHGLVGAPDVHI